jgi:hypothetical protein
LRAELAAKGLKLALLDGDDQSADRRYIEQFILARSRELGEKYGVAYAEAFQYIDQRTPRKAVEEYIRENSVPIAN